MAISTTEPKPAKTKKAEAEAAPKARREAKPDKTAKQGKGPKTPAVKAAPAPVWASPVKPSLILLPVKARGLKARRKAVRQSAFIGLGLMGVTAVGYIFVLAGVAGAQNEVNKEAAITTTTTNYLAQNRDVQDYATGFVKRKAAASDALQNDVSYSKVVQAVQQANTSGAVFTAIKTAAPGTQCTSSSPFAASSSLGCLDISGNAPSIAAVSQLVAALNRDKTMLSEPYLKESVSSGAGVDFKLTVGYTGQALSAKGDKFKPSPDELSSIEAPAAAPDPATDSTNPAAATQGASK
ncbi:hypothetical protein IV500_05440 [Paeniglutamicibacter antarcticus]|uniref:Uncharacterized protein n=1 Tax=Arthrobacter terrae TaxID=2935737 RepID=A0A931CPZ6_9MICC|nr:hypothetical protein [Arthrobacter terrae]MBG0738864.1 hypothetical protein [Arthrobacter terrae]